MVQQTPGEDLEQANISVKKQDPELTEKLIRQFLDAKLTLGKEGVEFYNDAKWSK